MDQRGASSNDVCHCCRGCGYQGKDIIFVPISGLHGVNLQTPVDKSVCDWWTGSTLFRILDEMVLPERDPREQTPASCSCLVPVAWQASGMRRRMQTRLCRVIAARQRGSGWAESAVACACFLPLALQLRASACLSWTRSRIWAAACLASPSRASCASETDSSSCPTASRSRSRHVSGALRWRTWDGGVVLVAAWRMLLDRGVMASTHPMTP